MCFRIILVTIAFGASLFATDPDLQLAYGATSDGSRYFLTFAARGNDHAFIVACTENAARKLSSCEGRGLYPNPILTALMTRARFVLGTVPGSIEDEAKHHSWSRETDHFTVEINANDYAWLDWHIRDMIADPPRYQYITHNCVTFIKGIAQELDIPVSNQLTHFTPHSFIEGMKDAVREPRSLRHGGYIYQGQVARNVPNGRGHEIYSDGSQYEGDFVLGTYHGSGVLTTAHGDQYKGIFQYGTFTHGTHRRPDGSEVRGDFNSKGANGFATVYDKDGKKIYEGAWKDGIAEGIGTRTTSEFVYHGDFKNGVPNGHGTVNFSSGNVYSGDIVNGIMTGHGIWTHPGGYIYDGSFVNGQISGHGIFKSATGCSLETTFANGKASGHSRYSCPSGVFEGDMNEGTATGVGKLKFSDGSAYEGEIVDYRPDGKGTFSSADGPVIVGIWSKGHLVRGAVKGTGPTLPPGLATPNIGSPPVSIPPTPDCCIQGTVEVDPATPPPAK